MKPEVIACESCGGTHETFREQIVCITAKAVGPDEAEVVVDRVAERLGGATHEEAVAKHPLPNGEKL